MIIASLLLAMPAFEAGSLKILRPESYQVCGTRRTGPHGPELVDGSGRVVVPVSEERQAEMLAPVPMRDGEAYCVSFERTMGIPKAVSISSVPRLR